MISCVRCSQGTCIADTDPKLNGWATGLFQGFQDVLSSELPLGEIGNCMLQPSTALQRFLEGTTRRWARAPCRR